MTTTVVDTTVDERGQGVTNSVSTPKVKTHLSYSALKSAADCLKAHQLERVLGLPTTPHTAAAAGRAFHKATELFDLAYEAN